MSAESCGCDREAKWICEEHRKTITVGGVLSFSSKEEFLQAYQSDLFEAQLANLKDAFRRQLVEDAQLRGWV